MDRILQILLLAATLSIAFVSFATAADPIKVVVSIPPQKYFIQKIGGDRVEASIMVPPGVDPHSYEPKPRQMVELSRATAYFSIGIGFEDVWLDKIAAANKGMPILRTDAGIEKIPMVEHGHDEEPGQEVHEGEEEPEGLDPHVWLSPVLVKTIARNMFEGLVNVDPEGRAVYETNLNYFLNELDALDARLREMFAGEGRKGFMVFHPAYGYLAREYGLEQTPIEIEGKEPKPGHLAELITEAKEHGVKVIFVQPQFSTKSAEALAREIGAEIAHADDLAEDWEANLLEIAGKFKAALR
jgi:zinc transport system substrate-binding protein